MEYKCGNCGSVGKYGWWTIKSNIKCCECRKPVFEKVSLKLKLFYVFMLLITISLEVLVYFIEFSSMYFKIVTALHIIVVFYGIFVIIELLICKKQEVEMPGSGDRRDNIKPGLKVKVVQKQDQRSGKLTEGIVLKLLTNSPTHPHGIKVMLEGGIVGRVKEIIG